MTTFRTEKSMNKTAFYLTAFVLCSNGFANDLSDYGLADATQLSEHDANLIRGLGSNSTQGLQSAITSVQTSSLAFSIVDTNSGSVFNLNANSQTRGRDAVSGYPSSLDGSLQSLGVFNSGGVQFGDAEFSMGEFGFGMTGVAAYGQSSQLAGPSSSLNFNNLLK